MQLSPDSFVLNVKESDHEPATLLLNTLKLLIFISNLVFALRLREACAVKLSICIVALLSRFLYQT